MIGYVTFSHLFLCGIAVAGAAFCARCLRYCLNILQSAGPGNSVNSLVKYRRTTRISPITSNLHVAGWKIGLASVFYEPEYRDSRRPVLFSFK